MNTARNERVISAGAWIRVQDLLGAVMRLAVIVGIVLAPFVAVVAGIGFGLKTGMAAYVGTASLSVAVAFWCYGLGGLLEPLRTDGIPVLER